MTDKDNTSMNQKEYQAILNALNRNYLEAKVKPESCKYQRYRNTVDELAALQNKALKHSQMNKEMNRIRSRLNTFVKQSAYAKSYSGEFRHEYERGMKIVPSLIEKLAMWEYKTYQEFIGHNPKAPSIEDLMSLPACEKAVRHMSFVKIAQIIYVEESIKSNIALLIPEHPKDEYPLARKLRRHFVIHYGFTNTGKTYHALVRLKQAETGVYLSPLRLLALEVQENLNASGVPCSLLTGEEEDIVPDARHMSSTVEKLNIQARYDVCVIDECQMIGDSQRGFAWTRAILGVQAEEIHLCTAPEALDLLKLIIEECGETYEVVEHTRNTELIYVHEKYSMEKDVEKGDALVVFSKKDVLSIASELFNHDIQASVIYGALPYNTRKKQLERFMNGETKVVVATDAIGMGLNLPIRRVIFMSDEKFDGTDVRRLQPNEVKQIAGRAGRRGIYDVGYVLTNEKCTDIDLLLIEPNAKVQKAYLGFSEILLTIEADIMDVLKIWANMRTSALYTKTDITRTLYLINELRTRGMNFSKGDLLKLTNIPFSEDNQAVFSLWLQYCIRYKNGMDIPMPRPESNDLYALEDYYKCLDLKYSFSKTMGTPYSLPLIREKKQETADKINEILISEISSHGKTCRSCGVHLSWDYPYGICEKCFQRSNSQYHYRYGRDTENENDSRNIKAANDQVKNISQADQTAKPGRTEKATQSGETEKSKKTGRKSPVTRPHGGRKTGRSRNSRPKQGGSLHH